jgi:hypothetical protein
MSSDLEQKMREQCLRPCTACSGSGFVRDEIAFGQRMQAYRESARVTLRVLATELGLSVGYLCDLEHGRKRWGSELTLKYINALGNLRRNLESDSAIAAASSPA